VDKCCQTILVERQLHTFILGLPSVSLLDGAGSSLHETFISLVCSLLSVFSHVRLLLIWIMDRETLGLVKKRISITIAQL
jgi:hypothetical protein